MEGVLKVSLAGPTATDSLTASSVGRRHVAAGGRHVCRACPRAPESSVRGVTRSGGRLCWSFLVSDAEVFVGVPAYENADTISETIHSLRGQTFRGWECVVTCDSPSRETRDAARAAAGRDERITVVQNESRLGVPANWNFLLARANAPFFKLLCADDVLDPLALEVQVQALKRWSSAVLCTARRRIIDTRGRTIWGSRGFRGSAGPLNLDAVIGEVLRAGTNVFGEPSFALYRTDALQRVGGFSERWRYLIDLASYVDVLTEGQLAPIDATIGGFRISSTSWSSSLATTQWRETSKFLDHLSQHSSHDISLPRLWAAKGKAAGSTLLRRALVQLSVAVNTTR